MYRSFITLTASAVLAGRSRQLKDCQTQQVASCRAILAFSFTFCCLIVRMSDWRREQVRSERSLSRDSCCACTARCFRACAFPKQPFNATSNPNGFGKDFGGGSAVEGRNPLAALAAV